MRTVVLTALIAHKQHTLMSAYAIVIEPLAAVCGALDRLSGWAIHRHQTCVPGTCRDAHRAGKLHV